MPRYRDDWLIDRVMFDYVSGGSCACCGMAFFLPNGTADYVTALSDLETDQQQAEIQALQNHPWPQDLRDQVWADRVRLRQHCKKDMAIYRVANEPTFVDWMTQQPLARLFQVSRAELMERMQKRYNIHSAYAVVLTAVLEQVAGFDLTQYPPDGRGTVELDFEKALVYDRRAGFTLRIVDSNGKIDDTVWSVWLARVHSLAGPKLLERGTSSNNRADDTDGDPDGPVASVGPSFASDRRIIRMMIARYWADLLIDRFRKEHETEEQNGIS